jgi:hypothetical protein
LPSSIDDVGEVELILTVLLKVKVSLLSFFHLLTSHY